MNFTEFNEKIDNTLRDLSDLSEKYDIFNESVSNQLDVNIEKAKVYIEESNGTDDDLIYLIKEASDEADDKVSSSVDKLQTAAADAFDAMSDEISRFADSAELAVILDKLEKSTSDLMDKIVSVEITSDVAFIDGVEDEILSSLSVLTVNVNAVLSDDKVEKIEKDVASVNNAPKKTVKEKAPKLVSIYKEKLADIKKAITSNKNISKKIKGIASDKGKWKERSEKNKQQISSLINKLTKVMSKKVSIIKTDLNNISKAIKAPKDSTNKIDKVDEIKESIVVSEVLDSVLNELFSEKKEIVDEPDEADTILAAIESEIDSTENKKIDDLEDITFDESTDVDTIVDNIISELL